MIEIFSQNSSYYCVFGVRKHNAHHQKFTIPVMKPGGGSIMLSGRSSTAAPE